MPGQNPSFIAWIGSSGIASSSAVEPVVVTQTPTRKALTTAYTTMWIATPTIRGQAYACGSHEYPIVQRGRAGLCPGYLSRWRGDRREVLFEEAADWVDDQVSPVVKDDGPISVPNEEPSEEEAARIVARAEAGERIGVNRDALRDRLDWLLSMVRNLADPLPVGGLTGVSGG